MILLQIVAAVCFAGAIAGLAGAAFLGPAPLWLGAAFGALMGGALVSALHRALCLLEDLRDEMRRQRSALDWHRAPDPHPLPGGRPMRPLAEVAGE